MIKASTLYAVCRINSDGTRTVISRTSRKRAECIKRDANSAGTGSYEIWYGRNESVGESFIVPPLVSFA